MEESAGNESVGFLLFLGSLIVILTCVYIYIYIYIYTHGCNILGSFMQNILILTQITTRASSRSRGKAKKVVLLLDFSFGIDKRRM